MIADILAERKPKLFRLGQENLDDLGIELRAGALADFLAGGGDGQGLAIGAVGGHGVERVCHRENARPQGNLLTLEAARITRAVEELLVGEDDLGSLARKS